MLNHPSCRIILTGDFLRPASSGFSPAAARDTLWLHRLLGRLIGHVSGQMPAMVGWGIEPAFGQNLGDDEIAAIYGEQGAPLSLEGWAQLRDRTDAAPHLDALAKTHFADALVIGFELPPIVEHALARAGARMIDIRLHPAGFLDDLLLALRASAPQMQAKLAARAMPPQTISLMADLAGAAALMQPFCPPPANSLLVLGKSEDLPARLDEGREQICTAAGKCAALLVPACEPDTLALLSSWGLTPSPTDAPLYGLLAHPHVSEVIALDGDRASEVRFFGRNALALRPARCPVDDTKAEAEAAVYHGIDGQILSSAFWSDLLEMAPPAPLALPPRPNRLRDSRNLAPAPAQSGQKDVTREHREPEDPLLDERLEELRLQQIANRSDIQVRLAGMEHELHRAQAALNAATRWQSDEMMYRKRSVLGRMVFRHNGRPTRSLRSLLFHASGKPRGLFRSWIINAAGEPRAWMRQWMTSPEYLAQPKAHHAPSLRPVLSAPRPFTAWRSVAGAKDLSPEELDALMCAIREEVQSSKAPSHD